MAYRKSRHVVDWHSRRLALTRSGTLNGRLPSSRLHNYCGRLAIQWFTRPGQPEDDPLDAQKARPARPQRVKRRPRTFRYVEPLRKARTPQRSTGRRYRRSHIDERGRLAQTRSASARSIGTHCGLRKLRRCHSPLRIRRSFLACAAVRLARGDVRSPI